MQKLSMWAKSNPRTSRWLIALNRILIGHIAFYVGMLLFIEKIDVSAGFQFSAIAFLFAFVFYPKKNKEGKYEGSFQFRKYMDGALVLSSTVFWLAAGNGAVSFFDTKAPMPVEVFSEAPLEYSRAQEASLLPTTLVSKKKLGLKKRFRKRIAKWKMLRKHIKRTRQLIKQGRANLNEGELFLLTLLSVGIILLLGTLAAYFACSLSCNGQEGAAAGVLVLAAVLIAAIIFVVWKEALKKANRKQEQVDS